MTGRLALLLFHESVLRVKVRGRELKRVASQPPEVLCSGERWQPIAFSSIHSDEEETLLIKPFTLAQKRFLAIDAYSTSKKLISYSYSE